MTVYILFKVFVSRAVDILEETILASEGQKYEYHFRNVKQEITHLLFWGKNKQDIIVLEVSEA